MSVASTLMNLFRTKAKGTTPTGFPTSKSVDANTQSMHVSLADAIPTGGNTVGGVFVAQTPMTTGNITSATSIVGPMSVVGMNMVTVTQSGIYAGISSLFEVSQDGVLWFPIQGRISDGSIVNGLTGYSNTAVAIDITLGGWSQYRVRATAYTSGTAALTMIAKASGLDRTPSALVVGYTPEGNPVFSFPPVLMGGSDGVNARMARFKAPGIASVAADPALVVGFSPNSPTPAGGNRTGQMQLVGTAASAAVVGGAYTSPYNTLQVSTEPSALFNDTFDGTVVDVVNRWNPLSVSGMNYTQSTGFLNLATAISSGSFALIDSQPTFGAQGMNFAMLGATVKLEAQSGGFFALNQHRFFGWGDRPATYAATTPFANAIGFEVGIDGQLYCSVFGSGVQRFRSAVNLAGVNLNTLVTQGGSNFTRFLVTRRGDLIAFYIGNLDTPVQVFVAPTTGFATADIQTLPVRIAAINAATGTVGATVFSFSTISVGDSGSNNNTLSDGTFNWRKAQVGKSGGLAVRAAMITGNTTSFPITVATTGPSVDVSEAANVTFIVKNTVAANAYGGAPVLVFEQSDDNVQWGPCSVVRSDTGASASTFTLGPNVAGASLMFDTASEGVNWVRCRATTGPATNPLTVVIQPGGLSFNPVVTSVQQPITKGLQGATGISNQALKDSGRVNIAITAYQAAGITTEGLFAATAFSISRDGAAPVTGAQFTVTPGKRFRIQSITVTTKDTSTTASTTKIALRYSGVGGVISATSSSLGFWDIGDASLTAGSYGGPFVNTYPDGLELVGASTFGFTNLASTVAILHTITLNGYEY